MLERFKYALQLGAAISLEAVSRQRPFWGCRVGNASRPRAFSNGGRIRFTCTTQRVKQVQVAPDFDASRHFGVASHPQTAANSQ